MYTKQSSTVTDKTPQQPKAGSSSNVLSYASQLKAADSPAARRLSIRNLAPPDLSREESNLTRLGEGVIEVVPDFEDRKPDQVSKFGGPGRKRFQSSLADQGPI